MKLLGQTCHVISVLCLLGSWVSGSSPHPLSGSRCDPTREYSIEDRDSCCKKCPPGSYASQRCTRQSDTQCQTCSPGDYTAFWNYIRECHLCTSCDHRRGLVIKTNCTPERNTECQCREGHHCVSWDNCAECNPHSECGPGSELVKPGSPTLDTICRKCPHGTFQNESTVEKCRTHKNCTALGLVEWKQGSAISDSICSEPMTTWVPDLKNQSSNRENNSLGKSDVLTVVLSITYVCCVFLAAFIVCKRRSKFCEDSTKENVTQNAAEDRMSLESKQPLLDSAPGLPGGRDAQGPEQAPERSHHLGQTEREHLTQRAGPPCSPPSGSPGGHSQHGAETPPGQRAHPEHKHRTQTDGDLGGEAGGAYGLLGIQGCHVESLNSKLTVNGPLYIYNGPVSSGAPGADGPERQENGRRHPRASRRETGGLPRQASGLEEASAYAPPNPVCQEVSGWEGRPVQEAGPGSGSRPQASGLASPLQEEGKETHGPDQEERPLSRPEPNQS